LNPDRLRWIDYWLGIPLCFALTVFSKIAAAFSDRGERGFESPRNVLFIELAEMGSTVLACPAVHQLRVLYPECQVFFLLFEHIDESVRVLGLVPDTHVMTINVSSARTILRDTLRFMSEARRRQIDTVINLETFGRFSTLLTYLSGARTRVGFHAFTQEGLYTGDVLTHKVLYNPHIHTWQSMVTLVKSLGVSPTEVPLGKFPASGAGECVVPRIASDPSSRRRMQDLLERECRSISGKRLIAINPNASKLISIRKWPLERYAQLVSRLIDDPRNVCIITGLASEREDARFILDRVKSDRLVDLTGKTTLRELIDLYNLADVLVTNDSGPAHFAALTDIHVVVFFGPETPELYRPLTDRCTVMYSHYACSPCVSAFNQRKSVCTNNRCLTHIEVETVHAAIADVLEARARGEAGK
jgi:ADP-heptose:LPS heptosyltransferase